MRRMYFRLLTGIRSGMPWPVDTMGAVITPLFTLYNPSVALWLRVEVRVRPCHGAWHMVGECKYVQECMQWGYHGHRGLLGCISSFEDLNFPT